MRAARQKLREYRFREEGETKLVASALPPNQNQSNKTNQTTHWWETNPTFDLYICQFGGLPSVSGDLAGNAPHFETYDGCEGEGYKGVNAEH